MNIDYISACISLRAILTKLKLLPVRETGSQSFYHSPFSKETAVTLSVDHEQNTWTDQHLQTCGGPFEFVTQWLKCQNLNCSAPDVLDWFKEHIGYPSLLDGINLPTKVEAEPKFIYQSPILNPSLIRFVHQQGVPLSFARKYLHQVGLTNPETGNGFVALGLKTEESSWYVISPYLDTFISHKSITYIPGQKYKYRRVHIFKDIFTYMKAVIRVNKGELFNDECIILNSYACLDSSAAYIRAQGYSKLYTWLGSDPNGQQATENYALLCLSEDGLQHKPIY